MALIKPFNAVRPADGLESSIAALPYDVYNRKEATEYCKTYRLSFLNIDRAETNLPDTVDTYDDCVYEKAKSLYLEMKKNGSYIKEEKPCFYLYEEIMEGRSQTGFVLCASVDEYESGLIKKHENTRADKEIDRIKHVDRLNAQTGPIFLAFKDRPELKEFLVNYKKENKPYFDFVSEDGITHKGWKVDKEQDIEFLINGFAKVDALYIADGHHRCASAVKVSKMRKEALGSNGQEEYNFFLSVVFPESELAILDYNRVVKDLNGLNKEDFINKVSEKFEVKEIPVSEEKPSNKGDIYMLFEDSEYLIRVKEAFLSSDPVDSLDVSYLQRLILDPILGIEDPKTDKRIDFVGGIRGVKELKKRLNEDSKVAFCMYPTQMNELFNVADAGLLMPPKSTWFEPKLRSGLFIHEI